MTSTEPWTARSASHLEGRRERLGAGYTGSKEGLLAAGELTFQNSNTLYIYQTKMGSKQMGTFGCPVSSLIFSLFLDGMECPGPQATVVGFSTGKIVRETKHSTQVTADPSSEPLNQRG